MFLLKTRVALAISFEKIISFEQMILNINKCYQLKL